MTELRAQSGGPDYQVELGRYDGRVSNLSSVVLPQSTFNLDQLNRFFSSLGLSQADMIALSGKSKHTRKRHDHLHTCYKLGELVGKHYIGGSILVECRERPFLHGRVTGRVS